MCAKRFSFLFLKAFSFSFPQFLSLSWKNWFFKWYIINPFFLCTYRPLNVPNRMISVTGCEWHACCLWSQFVWVTVVPQLFMWTQIFTFLNGRYAIRSMFKNNMVLPHSLPSFILVRKKKIFPSSQSNMFLPSLCARHVCRSVGCHADVSSFHWTTLKKKSMIFSTYYKATYFSDVRMRFQTINQCIRKINAHERASEHVWKYLNHLFMRHFGFFR